MGLIFISCYELSLKENEYYLNLLVQWWLGYSHQRKLEQTQRLKTLTENNYLHQLKFRIQHQDKTHKQNISSLVKIEPALRLRRKQKNWGINKWRFFIKPSNIHRQISLILLNSFYFFFNLYNDCFKMR